MVFGGVLDAGSSPRMRGALSGDGAAIEDVGIIPADAGSTLHYQLIFQLL